MRISKMMLNLAILTAVASIAGSATASSSCNMQSKAGRYAASNPKEKSHSTVQKKSESAPKKSTSQRNKGTAG